MTIGRSELLKASLVVEGTGTTGRVRDRFLELVENQRASRIDTTVEVDGADHGFDCVGQDGGFLSSARRILALAQPEIFAETERDTHLGERDRAHDGGSGLGELPLGLVRQVHIEVLSDDDTEHGIAEELESFVRGLTWVFGTPGTMRQRDIEKSRVDKLMPEPLFKSDGGGRCSQASAQLRDDVVDGVSHGAEILEVFVVDTETRCPFGEFFLEALDEFDQREGVGVEIIGERVTLIDARGLDLENVGELVSHDRENLFTLDRTLLYMGFCGHFTLH